MSKYIDSEKLIAEIERRYKEYHSNWEKTRDPYLDGKADALDLLLPFITHLYHEQTEVDLEKEVNRWKNKHGVVGMDDLWINFARHFAEWGAIHLNARKEE